MSQLKDDILQRFRQNPESFLRSIEIEKLRFNEREAKGQCPLHDDHSPSFSINLEKGLWKCFAGCGAGDLFSLYQKKTSFGGSFYELLQEMNQL